MISLPAGVRVLLATRPVDFRRGAHTLAALAAAELGENPFSGVVLVFRSKRSDKVKIVHWDATGLVLVWKQLEGSRSCWPPITERACKIVGGWFRSGSIPGSRGSRGRWRNWYGG